MDYEKFEELLKKTNLSKKEFSELVGMNYVSITNWNKSKIPPWVESWLENYISKKKYEHIKNIIKDEL